MIKKYKAALLIEDMTLYPRNDVDEVNIAHLVEALQVGAELPKILIEETTLRIVDGFHRRRAYMRAFGDDVEVTCEVKKYKDDAELFLEAVRLNANHGINMDGYDRTHAMAIAGKVFDLIVVWFGWPWFGRVGPGEARFQFDQGEVGSGLVRFGVVRLGRVRQGFNLIVAGLGMVVSGGVVQGKVSISLLRSPVSVTFNMSQVAPYVKIRLDSFLE